MSAGQTIILQSGAQLVLEANTVKQGTAELGANTVLKKTKEL